MGDFERLCQNFQGRLLTEIFEVPRDDEDAVLERCYPKSFKVVGAQMLGEIHVQSFRTHAGATVFRPPQ